MTRFAGLRIAVPGHHKFMRRVSEGTGTLRTAMTKRVLRRVTTVAVRDSFRAVAIGVEDKAESEIESVLECVIKQPDALASDERAQCLWFQDRLGRVRLAGQDCQQRLVEFSQLTDGSAQATPRAGGGEVFFAIPKRMHCNSAATG